MDLPGYDAWKTRPPADDTGEPCARCHKAEAEVGALCDDCAEDERLEELVATT